MWTKDHKWPVGGDLCMDPIDSSWERPDVFKLGLPDHFGKAQAIPQPRPPPSRGGDKHRLVCSLELFSLGQSRVEKNFVASGVWVLESWDPPGRALVSRRNQKPGMLDFYHPEAITSWEIDGETVETVADFIFLGLQNHCRWWLQPWNYKLTTWKESYDQPRKHIKKQRHYFANKGPSSQCCGFSSGHVWMWELYSKES